MLNKDEKEKCFAYSLHSACDRNGFILAVETTAANVHDSTKFESVLESVKRNLGEKPKYVAVDSGYKTPHICKTLIDQGIEPVMPYKGPMTKQGFMRKYEYAYDEYYDCYICPNNQVLRYVTTNREGYREYKSDPKVCVNCPYLAKCTASKDHTKYISRHIWSHYVEEADHLRHMPENKAIYEKRKETIERVFADMKEKHGMRWTTLRGLQRVSAQAMLVAACMNLKKLANWLWKSGKTGPKSRKIFLNLINSMIKDRFYMLETVFVYKLRLLNYSTVLKMLHYFGILLCKIFYYITSSYNSNENPAIINYRYKVLGDGQ